MLKASLYQVKFEKIMMIQIIGKLVKQLYRGKVKSFQSNYRKLNHNRYKNHHNQLRTTQIAFIFKMVSRTLTEERVFGSKEKENQNQNSMHISSSGCCCCSGRRAVLDADPVVDLKGKGFSNISYLNNSLIPRQ